MRDKFRVMHQRSNWRTKISFKGKCDVNLYAKLNLKPEKAGIDTGKATLTKI